MRDWARTLHRLHAFRTPRRLRGTAAESLITYVADRPGCDRGYVIDASKIEHELGFVSEETFETGIAKTVDWFLSNESWSRSVMDGSYRT